MPVLAPSTWNGQDSDVVHCHPRDPSVWWALGRTGRLMLGTHMVPGILGLSVLPRNYCCLCWLVAPGGDIAPWVVLVAETLLLPSHSTKISTSFLSVYHRKKCYIFSLFFPNITNDDSLGIREMKMPNSPQGRQAVGHWQAGVAILCHLRGLGSSLCRDPSSPRWPQADCKEPSKGSSWVLVETQECWILSIRANLSPLLCPFHPPWTPLLWPLPGVHAHARHQGASHLQQNKFAGVSAE